MAKRGLAKMKEQHPVCCFCGGVRETTSRDHQPARVFFQGKRMPDDFVFPACTKCQGTSREAENALSLVVVPRGYDRAALRKRAAHYHRNDPALVEELFPTPDQKASFLEQLGIDLPAGTSLDDVPMVKMGVDRWQPHLDIISLKLVLALHYKYIGRALPASGRVLPRFYFNAHVTDGELFREFQTVARRLDNPRHGSESLHEQIQVQWTVNVDEGLGIFLTHLHSMLFVFGITAESEEAVRALEEDADEDIRGPLIWP